MKRLRALLAWVVGHAVIVLIILGLVTIFFGAVILVKGAPETRNPTEKVLIKNLPSTQFYNKFVKTFGNDDLILIVVKAPEGKTVLDPTVLEVVQDITARANGVPDAEDEAYKGINARVRADIEKRLVKAGASKEEAAAQAATATPVREVVSLTIAERDLFNNLPALYKRLQGLNDPQKRKAFFRRFLQGINLFTNNLVSRQLDATTITLIVGSNAEDVVGYVREIVDAGNEMLPVGKGEAKLVYQIGSPVIADEVVQYLKTDLKTLSGFTLGLIVIILAVCFRSVRGVVLPLISAGAAYVWTFGLMSLMGADLNMITVVIPTLLIAIGNAYALHVVSEFFEEAAEGRPGAEGRRGARRLKKEIVTSTLFKVSLPVFLAGATTLIGFGSLALNRIDMIREFAFFSCFGLLALIVLSLTLLPALLALLPLPRQKKREEDAPAEDPETKRSPVLWFLRGLHRLDVKGQVFVYIAAIAVIALSIAGLLQLKVENAIISFFKSDAPVRTNFEDIQEVMAGCYTIRTLPTFRNGPSCSRSTSCSSASSTAIPASTWRFLSSITSR